MKRIYLYLFALLGPFAAACDKSMDVGEPVFEVTGYSVENRLDSAGNPIKSVTFTLDGNADIISFYSGETLRDYNFREGRVVKTKNVTMSFSSNCKLNSGTIAMANQLSVVASTNFTGQLNDTAVQAASWTDITGRFKLSPLVATDNFLPSGEADVSDLFQKGKPLYIAFKYVTPPQTTALRHTQWRMRDYLLRRNTELGLNTLASQSATPWNLYHKGPFESGRSANSTSQLILRGNNSAANFSEPTEDWAISPAIQVVEDTDIGPDRPFAIKTRIDVPISVYTFNYSKPGTYKAVFVASNVTASQEVKVVKTIDVVIK
ncbi:hypothetical protein C7T94_14315 [Pedobacter yulinensis]|uniref:DUF5017 domain-containing protein n=1 Tax=Pedobacter yulinensis TaxID=2126353 RepID=A0A2T3HMN8_9SPHI|nr:DUF5017 domain-containing protein [Pedobacter yulinensis]PST83697.1 hypothetical protein C7T94_14315 [Pedobacter yulinensis]